MFEDNEKYPSFTLLCQKIKDLIDNITTSFRAMPGNSLFLYIAYLIKINNFPDLETTFIRQVSKKLENFVRHPDLYWFISEDGQNLEGVSADKIANIQQKVIQYIILTQHLKTKKVSSSTQQKAAKFITAHTQQLEKELQTEENQQILSLVLSNKVTFAVTEKLSIEKKLADLLYYGRYGLVFTSAWTLSQELKEYFRRNQPEDTPGQNTIQGVYFFYYSILIFYILYTLLAAGLPKPNQHQTISWHAFTNELKHDAELCALFEPNIDISKVWFENSQLPKNQNQHPSLLRGTMLQSVVDLDEHLSNRDLLKFLIGLLENNKTPQIENVPFNDLFLEYLKDPQKKLIRYSPIGINFNTLMYYYLMLAVAEHTKEKIAATPEYPQKPQLASYLQQKIQELENKIAEIESKPLPSSHPEKRRIMGILTLILFHLSLIIADTYKTEEFMKSLGGTSFSIVPFLNFFLPSIIAGIVGGPAAFFLLHKADNWLFPSSHPEIKLYNSLSDFFREIPTASQALLPAEKNKEEEQLAEPQTTEKQKTL